MFRTCAGSEFSRAHLCHLTISSSSSEEEDVPREVIRSRDPPTQSPVRRNQPDERISFSHERRLGLQGRRASAWMIVEANTKNDARSIVPPPFRPQASIVELNTFSMDQIDSILSRHTTDR